MKKDRKKKMTFNCIATGFYFLFLKNGWIILISQTAFQRISLYITQREEKLEYFPFLEIRSTVKIYTSEMNNKQYLSKIILRR